MPEETEMKRTKATNNKGNSSLGSWHSHSNRVAITRNRTVSILLVFLLNFILPPPVASSLSLHHPESLSPTSNMSKGGGIDSIHGDDLISPLISTASTVAQHRSFRAVPSSSVSMNASKKSQIPALYMNGGDDGSDSDHNAKGGSSSIKASIFNLSNNVAGAGMLTLAAAMANSGTGYVPAVLVVGVLSLISGRTFAAIGRCCEVTGQTSFKGLWANAFHERSSYIVDLIIFVQCFLSSTIYVGLLGDIFSAFLQHQLPSLPQYLSSRPSVICFMSIFVLFPLNLIRNLSALKFTSILGLISVLYTVVFMSIRALDGTYSAVTIPIGRFVSDSSILPTPTFKGSSLYNLDLRSLVLVSNLGLAFIAHYNAPAYWRELRDATRDRFNSVVRSAYFILFTLYTTAMVAGYSTFGDTCRGNILLNYNPHDKFAMFGRLATGLSVLFGFPLVSAGCKEGLKGAAPHLPLGLSALAHPSKRVTIAAGTLALASCLAMAVEDVKIVAGFSGALSGSFVVYILPCIIRYRLFCSKNNFGVSKEEQDTARRDAMVFVPFGIIIAIMGVIMTYRSI